MVKIRIAVARGQEFIRTCGPQDYDEADHNDAMSAALCWLLEAGDILTDSYWVTVNLPAVASKEIAGELESG